MFKIFVLFFLVSLSTFAKDKYVKGEGHFWAEEGDSLSFIKKQLLHQGFKNVISKELSSMDLNNEEFWNKYQDKFKTEKEKEIKEALDKRFNIYVDPDAKIDVSIEPKILSQKQQKTYDKQLRKKSLVAKISFGNLSRVIRSFAIKKISRSPQNPKSRYISIEAKIDRVYLSKIYYEFMREQKPKDVSRLYVFTDFDLQNTSWSDMGVGIKSEFTSAVDESWRKWLEENKLENLEEIKVLSTEGKKELAHHFNSSYQQLIASTNEKFKDSLVLKVHLKIEKLFHHEIFKEYEFAFMGDVVLFDLLTNKVLFKDEIKPQIKTYRNIDYADLKNAVANFVYRIPLGKFTNMKKFVGKASKVDSAQKLLVENFSNIDEVFKFIELLKNKGIKLRVNPVLHSFNSSKAEVIVYYQGGNETLDKFITKLKGFTGSQNFDFDFFPKQNYRVKLLKRKAKRSKASDEITLLRKFKR